MEGKMKKEREKEGEYSRILQPADEKFYECKY